MKTIYHLAISRLKYNKGRSILTIVAIALMTTLLMSIGSSALTVIRHQQLEIKESARNYHAAFKGSTADQVFILENHADVESLSTRESVASIELPKLNAVLNFDSTKKGSIDQIQLANGKMPVEADEIAGPPALFERLDVVPEIGQKFQIPLRIQGGKVENYDFTITGILEQTDISKLNVNETRLVYGAFVSEKFVEQHIAPEDRTYTAFTGTLMASTNSSDDTFLIADEVLQQLITETNPTSAIYITVQPEKFENVKRQIDELQQENTKFMFKSYDEELGIAKQLIRTIQYTIYGLLIVIGIIGYISLINTMITSILVRKKELGILQAIGLSDKQLRQMIHREGMFFTFGTLVLSLTIGNGLGYLLVRIIINTQILTISQYEYPITQTLVLTVAVVIGQIAITVFVNRYIHKQSLVERMRD